ncbi:bifunctional phosphopantothenoylcysteine decarboxylase/phosphopantothenate synthase [Parerythrobacter lacustris]|uniref:Coenzyme A biosynthesis bifunctional protein CoaBC n=1 Tax=Parerythrobacter lacustris TaxID=2969984 RepID=A0ABT1XQC2_9SPHN|nr:bifunctional phosphopantothenoylcysteine decarboxylase/phosphopantothenate synthase [Parerythrobacter lacustris]MCR2832667.1 bifunctional phosphopantothenoylcysteine decarboxylase/phosphopantothenate synthase [Parerythrobacter lacustris]
MSEAVSPRILLVVGGGIAAYKACELVRLIRKGGGSVTCVVTEGGQQFVTPMALAALSENRVYTTLWDLKNEAEMGHIQLSREADLVVVCPATADLLAKMTAGIADDLATTLILATDKPVMVVPAMNVRMWQHEATQRNVAWLAQAGVQVIDPDTGPMACGEFGPGRLPDPEVIWAEIAAHFGIAADCEPAERHELYEALEPEEEVVPHKSSSGLGGLLSSLIARTTPKRSEEDLEAQWQEVAEREQPDEAQEMPLPADAGPVMAIKGSARAAPPTDPDAINHTVSTGAGNAAPQPMAGDVRPAVVRYSDFDPLEGQPDFDTDIEHRPLYGRHVLVTAGPTHEPIDPVRYLANRSSGKQGFAIAAAAAAQGARVTLVAGPVHLDTPPGVDRIDVESAREMADEVKKALPVDVAIMAAAVADWRTKDYHGEKVKKRGSAPPALMLTENPDILANVASGGKRPKLLIGFAAETEDVIANAQTKLKRKGVDWIVANDVSGDVMGGAANTVHIVTGSSVEHLDTMPKQEVARQLIDRVAKALETIDDD